MAMNIEEIRKKYNDGGYTHKATIPNKVKPDHVFDEELSVKRNRELVQEYNNNIDLMKKDHNTKQGELYKQLEEDVIEYIMAYYNLSRKQAEQIESFTYQHHHSFMGDYFSYIDIYADFAFMLIE